MFALTLRLMLFVYLLGLRVLVVRAIVGCLIDFTCLFGLAFCCFVDVVIGLFCLLDDLVLRLICLIDNACVCGVCYVFIYTSLRI